MDSLARFGPLVLAALLAVPSFAAAKSPLPANEEKVAKLVYQPGALAWDPQIAYRTVTLRVVGPGGFVHDRAFGTEKPVFEASTMPGLVDGQYTYELVFNRPMDASLAKAVADVEFAEDGTIADPALRKRVSAQRQTASGSFRVEGGKIVSPSLVEPPIRSRALAKEGSGNVPKDIIEPDDVIVQGSLCAGLDCVSGEVFGFDTIRLKENNTRIQFDDTSSTAGFATNNWQIRANSSASGGPSFLAFVDQGPDGNSETGQIVFSVAAGAPANALIVDSAGNVGVRTATPVLDVHARTGDTPGIRLEQDSGGGFTAQTWDVAGNEANFFVRDVTGGSRLPLRIRPGAPTSSLDIGAGGNVGIGTAPPAAETSSPYLFVGKRFSLGTSASAGSQYIQISNNALFDGATPKYVETGPANQLYMNGDTTVFRRAASGTAGTAVPWAESLRIDAAGRVGVGGTPAAAEASSPYLFVGSHFSIGTSAAAGPGYVQLSNNAIFNGVSPTYVGAGAASQVYMNGDAIVFRRAPSGVAGAVVPWSETIRVDATGTRITGDLHVTGACCGPDYVFDPAFKLASIEENAAYMWKNRHLPAVGPAKTTSDGRTEVNVFAQSKGMLEELEKAHIYIEQLHREIQALKLDASERDSEFRRELAEIRRHVER